LRQKRRIEEKRENTLKKIEEDAMILCEGEDS